MADDGTRPYLAAKVFFFALGGLTLVCGAVAVFLSPNDAAAASLVVAGAALLVLAVLVERVSMFRAGPIEVQLRKLAHQQEATAAAVKAGVSDLSARIDEQAEELSARVRPLAAEYERIRSTTPSSRARAAELNRRIVEPARRHAQDSDVSRETVEFLFDSGGEGNRLTALAFMQGRPDAASLLVLESAILHAASDFEQFHGLLAAESAIVAGALDGARRAQLVATVEEAVQAGMVGDAPSDRLRLAKRIAGLD